MLILSRVSVDLKDRRGKVIFRIKSRDRLKPLEAPEEVRFDPMFDLLIAEGSMDAVVSAAQKHALENDPIQNTDASGKRIATESAEETETGKQFAIPAALRDAKTDEKNSASAALRAAETDEKISVPAHLHNAETDESAEKDAPAPAEASASSVSDVTITKKKTGRKTKDKSASAESATSDSSGPMGKDKPASAESATSEDYAPTDVEVLRA